MEPVARPEFCQIACYYEPECYYWTYRVDKHRCHLKTTQGTNNQMKINYISGPKFCNANDKGKSIHLGVCRDGISLGNGQLASSLSILLDLFVKHTQRYKFCFRSMLQK